MSFKFGKAFELARSKLSRLLKSGTALRFPSTLSKSVSPGNDAAQSAIGSFLENNKSVQFLGKSLEDLKKASTSKLEDYVGRCSLVYDSITGRDTVRQAGISVLEAEQAFVEAQLNRRRCQQKLFEVQKKRAEISKQLDIISRAADSFIPLITKEHEYAVAETRLVEEYTEADRLERAAYEKFGSHLRFLHAEERNYDKRMRQWGLMGTIAAGFLSALVTWLRVRGRAIDPDKFANGMESVDKLVLISEEIQKSVNAIPSEARFLRRRREAGRKAEKKENCILYRTVGECRLLRKPDKLISTSQLPQEEREEVEDEFQKWLEETKRNETVTKMSLPIIEDPVAIPGVPAVRSEGCISAATGKGTKRVTSTVKSSKPRTYEEWSKIEKELEKELEDQEGKNAKDFEGAAASNPTGCGDSSSAKPSCAGLAAKAETMPVAVRRIHAQREKEKGNEALQAGDNQEALGYYNRSLIYHPTTAVYNNRALLYLKTKKWKLALNDCNRVIKEEPQNVKALFRRARALYEIHSLEKAEADLNEVLAIESDNQKAQNLLKVVREEHAKRQRSNIEGGRRMVIEEEEESDDDDDDEEEEEEEEEEEDDEDDENAQEEAAADKEAERRRKEAETRAAMEAARQPTPSTSSDAASTKPSSSRRTANRYKGPERTAYGDHSPVRRGVVLEEVVDDSEEEEQEQEEVLQNGKTAASEAFSRSAEERSRDTSHQPAVACPPSKPSTVQKTGKTRERPKEESKKEVIPEELDPEMRQKKRQAKLIRRVKTTGLENLSTMLDIKLDAEMLEDYIYGLQTISLPQNEYEFIYKVLEAISRSPRFGIACLLLDAEAAGAARTLFDELRKSPVSSQLDIEKLQQKYVV